MKFFSLIVLSAMLSVTACSSKCKKPCTDKEACAKDSKECKEKCEKSGEMCHKTPAAAAEPVKVEEKKVETKKKKR